MSKSLHAAWIALVLCAGVAHAREVALSGTVSGRAATGRAVLEGGSLFVELPGGFASGRMDGGETEAEIEVRRNGITHRLNGESRARWVVQVRWPREGAVRVRLLADGVEIGRLSGGAETPTSAHERAHTAETPTSAHERTHTEDPRDAGLAEMPRRRMQAWRSLVSEHDGADTDTQLREVNRHFNRYTYVSDSVAHGRTDHWSTPREFVVAGGGDCEDYAIAKYYTLRQLGVPDDQLLLCLVYARRWTQHHMVLLYYPSPGAVPYVLDNLETRVRTGAQRDDLDYLGGTNESGTWHIHSDGRKSHSMGTEDALPKWTTLRNRRARDPLAHTGGSSSRAFDAPLGE